ncbi:hypothetical protein J2T13_004181 [Paenibacillus sp. DS2015]|uniref:hypothetical protein n=1 Tax=Paenibacillus sp. DS2015 TaxID=3373917 RepID=UPI003D1FE1BB
MDEFYNTVKDLSYFSPIVNVDVYLDDDMPSYMVGNIRIGAVNINRIDGTVTHSNNLLDNREFSVEEDIIKYVSRELKIQDDMARYLKWNIFTSPDGDAPERPSGSRKGRPGRAGFV